MKGFTHTLEAVIGSLLMLSIVTVVVPQLSAVEATDTEINSLRSLDVVEKMDDLSAPAAEEEVEPLLPIGYSSSAFIRETSTETIRISSASSEDVYINRTGGSLYLHVFADSNSFNTTYRGSYVAKNADSGYYTARSSETSGYFNVTGDASVTVEAVNQSISGDTQSSEDADLYSFPYYSGSPGEVRIATWQ